MNTFHLFKFPYHLQRSMYLLTVRIRFNNENREEQRTQNRPLYDTPEDNLRIYLQQPLILILCVLQ